MSTPIPNPIETPTERSAQRRRGAGLWLSVALCAASAIASSASAQNVLDPGVRDSRPKQGGAAQSNRLPSGRIEQGGRNQPGLGSGTSLDRNLQRGSGGINAPIPQPNFNARNLLATGNVAGGRGFRGSVGYTAAGDFRSAAGSDAIFRFQAESALSSTYFLTLRSTDRLSLAQDFGTYEFRRDTTPDSIGTASTQRLRLDRAAATMASNRTFELEAEAAPFARGRDNANRNVDFVASTVQGLRMRRPEDPIDATGLSTFEKARVRQDVASGSLDAKEPTRAFASPLQDARKESLSDGKRVEARVSDPVQAQRSSYDQIVKRVLEQYGNDPRVNIDANADAVSRAKADLQRVRDALGGHRAEPTDDDPLVDPITKLPRKPIAAPGSGQGAEGGNDDPNQPNDTPPNGATSQKEIRRLQSEADTKASVTAAAGRLRHGTTVRDLAPGERARVDELVRDGQVRLADGDFFRAERCFTQALELNPDNPLLYAGLAHAQIGAGLHLSAALTLRTLFSNNPEMIDTRYERVLLPNETRMRLAVETLRKRIALKQDADGYGITLAYLGHQLDEKDFVKEGLEAVTGTMENDLLRELLSQIWLGDPTESSGGAKKDGEPATTPQPPSGSQPQGGAKPEPTK